MLVKHTVSITTDAAGDFTGYIGTLRKGSTTLADFAGTVHMIKYTEGTLAASLTDVTIKGETTDTPILTLTNQSGDGFFYPRASAVDTGNTAITNSAEKIKIKDERIKVTVAQGGANKSGTIEIWMEEE